MDSLTDLQSPPQEQTQSIPPPNGPSPATISEDTITQRPPPPRDPHDVYVRALKKKRDEKLRALGKTFGNIPDVPIFTHWRHRVDCSNAAVHRSLMAGICGNSKDGAYSVALSNIYKDDEDGGDIIIYTGAGGRERWSNTFPPKPLRVGPQTLDQSWDNSANKALIISFHTGNPVRVIRSWRCGSQYAPLQGYRYDGLYKVAAYWTAKGRNGKNICRCRLERLPDQPPIPIRPITISTSKRRCNQRLISYPTPTPTPTPLPFSNPNDISDKTDFDTQSNSSPAQLTGSTGGEPGGLPNLPQQRAVSEASTRIDFNMDEVGHDMKVPQPLSPQRLIPSNPVALPRYKWDPKKKELVKLPASKPIPGDLGAAGGDEEDSDEADHRVEDDVTLVGHAVNEHMETECFSDTGNSLRYETPDEPPASGSSSASEN